MKKKSVFGYTLSVVLVIGCALLLTFTTGCKRQCGKKSPERIKKMVTWVVDDVLDDIDATEEQTLEINYIKESLINEAIEEHKKDASKRGELLEEWEKENPDMKKIHAFVDKKVAKKSIFAHKVADALKEIHEILTPEQRVKISEKVKNHLTDHFGDDSSK